MQYPDGTFPLVNQVLTIVDSRGKVLPEFANGALFPGGCQSDYLYYDLSAATWKNGGSEVHIGCGAGATGQGAVAVAV